MDPITAWANAITAVANMVTEIVKGQTPEQKSAFWKMTLDGALEAAKNQAAVQQWLSGLFQPRPAIQRPNPVIKP